MHIPFIKTRPALAHRLGAIAAAGALAASATVVSTAAPAWAYGTDHLYQVTISANCQNQTICNPEPFGVGGAWGWIELDSGAGAVAGLQSADGQMAFQGHSNSTALGGNPENNSRLTVSWFYGWKKVSCVGSTSAPVCALLPLETIPPDPNGNYFEIVAPFYGGTELPILVPATPGSYGVNNAPGISTQITVTEMH